MKSVRLPLLLFVACAAFAQVKITPGPEKVTVDIGGKPFTAFYVAGPEVTKPYLHPLRAASGTYVTRMWPMEKVEEEASIAKPDHQHQRGLWVAYLNVNKINFWENEASYTTKPNRGKITLGAMGKIVSGKDKGSIAATFNWTDLEDHKVLTESRVMTFYNDPALRTIDLDFTLTAVQQATFGDDKDGFLGIRMRPVLQEKDGTGHITNADGLAGMKDVWGKPSNWCDYSGVIGSEKVGITILDHPENPSHPVRWHARDYGLFAANPFAVAAFTNDKSQTKETVLEPGKSLHFRYRIIIHPGDADSANIPAQWKKYIAAK